MDCFERLFMKFLLFFQIYCISCLVQLLRIRFHKMLHFTIKFLALLFKFIASPPPQFTPSAHFTPPSPSLPHPFSWGGGGGGDKSRDDVETWHSFSKRHGIHFANITQNLQNFAKSVEFSSKNEMDYNR